MGIQFSHGAPQSSEPEFQRLRLRIAKALDLQREPLGGRGGRKCWDDVDDPLMTLLKQPVTRGRLLPVDAHAISGRLHEIAPGLHPESRSLAASLAAALAKAAFLSETFTWK